MTQDWTDAIAGERMKLDGEFSERVGSSSLTSQQWSLVMTAVDFEIENPSNPGEARLVAVTDSLPAVEEELDRIQEAGPGSGDQSSRDRGGGGLLSRVFGAFGGNGTNESGGRRDEAETLADEYAERLQQRLVDQGRWEDVCRRAAGG